MQNIVLFGQAANTLETLMIPLSLNKPSYGEMCQMKKLFHR